VERAWRWGRWSGAAKPVTGAGSFGRTFDRTFGAGLSVVSFLALVAVNWVERAERSQVLIIVPLAGAEDDK